MLQVTKITHSEDISPEVRDKLLKLSLCEMGYMSQALEMFLSKKLPCVLAYLTSNSEIVSWCIYLLDQSADFEYKNLFCFTHKLHRRNGYGTLLIASMGVTKRVCEVDDGTANRKAFWDYALRREEEQLCL